MYHQQEVYWSQRARQPWLQRGDKNTKFFHMAASLRSRKKKIMFLKLEDGTFTSDPLQIQQAFLNHFKNIYQTSDAPASGRCVLAKHSLQSIPLYQLLVFKAPTYFIRQIRSVASNFIWKNSLGTGFIWKSWRHLCLPKLMGGICLKDPGAMNQSSVS